MLSKTLRDRIGGLIRQGALDAPAALSNGGSNGHAVGASDKAGAAPGPFAPEPRRHFVATGIEEILPGGVIETAQGTVFAHERLYTDLGERPVPLLRRLAELCAYPGCAPERNGAAPHWVEVPGVDCPYPALPERARARRRRPRDLAEATGLHDPPEQGLFRRFGYRRVLYLDIETCGLSAAPVFLVGLCMVGDRNLILRQLFARDYAEERALLVELKRLAGEHDFLVTFNGKAFDVPFLRDRAIHHRLEPPIAMPHLDLLWMARRRWKDLLPDCKLKTIEWRVLRRRRAGDVGGSEIPGLYHDYVKRGEAHRLLPVFHHNLLDVVAMVELTPVIFDPDVGTY
ncbi:MAG TPA: ribonuclease H-like domain-containing protein [Candidatus Eisenbacteria bacterium]|nr:ribonuclease H-like domain-containing protein [Candidatus Eisenbacteria bacterium]